MIIAGLDLGKNKAALSIFADGELSHVEHIELSPDMRRPLALKTLSSWCYGFTKAVDSIYIEEPLAGRNVRQSLQLAQTCGAVMAEHGQMPMGKPVYLVPVKSWKKTICGNGNASKEMVRTWLESTHPVYASSCGRNQDRIDATCIGLYGVHVEQLAHELVD